jgi:hypothetical protein
LKEFFPSVLLSDGKYSLRFDSLADSAVVPACAEYCVLKMAKARDHDAMGIVSWPCKAANY